MENYYEILEVSEKASNEVIEKAYKVLAKKYHPDLQENKNKQLAEEKMKKINEAYDILSNEEKRAEYDEKLMLQRQQDNINNVENKYKGQEDEIKQYRIKQEQYRKQEEEAYRRRQEYEREEEYRRREEIYRQEQEQYKRQLENQKYEQEYRKKVQEKLDAEYKNAYYNQLKSLGYKVKEKWTLKKFLNFLKALGIMAIIIIILYVFPPTNKLIVDFYENNPILKGIFNSIGKIIEAIWLAISNLIANPPKL